MWAEGGGNSAQSQGRSARALVGATSSLGRPSSRTRARCRVPGPKLPLDKFAWPTLISRLPAGAGALKLRAPPRGGGRRPRRGQHPLPLVAFSSGRVFLSALGAEPERPSPAPSCARVEAARGHTEEAGRTGPRPFVSAGASGDTLRLVHTPPCRGPPHPATLALAARPRSGLLPPPRPQRGGGKPPNSQLRPNWTQPCPPPEQSGQSLYAARPGGICAGAACRWSVWRSRREQEGRECPPAWKAGAPPCARQVKQPNTEMPLESGPLHLRGSSKAWLIEWAPGVISFRTNRGCPSGLSPMRNAVGA